VSHAKRPVLRRVSGAALALVCGVVAYGVYSEAEQSGSLDSQISILQQQNRALQQQLAERQQQVVEAQTTAWLMEEARKLGYVLPGERSFVLTGPGVQAPPQGGVVAPLPTFKPPTPSPSPSSSPAASPSPTPPRLSPGPPTPSATP
jgi:Septum formation initiator